MAKEFNYKGKTLGELKEMSNEEFAKIAKSRRRRSLLRGIDSPLMKRVDKALKEKQAGKEPKSIRTHKREAIILPKFVGLKFAIYNGHEFILMEAKDEMIGHTLGEFSQTRKRLQHGKAGIGATRSSTAVNARG